MVKPFRHVVLLADLDDAESAELGPLLRQTAAVVTQLVEPEQVYTCLWSHRGAVPVHIHSVVQPITRSDMTRFDALGPDLQVAMFQADVCPDEEEIERICERFRGVFGPHD